MPETEVAELGRVEYAESDVYTFPAGIPAFEERRRFLLLRPPHLTPLAFLVSLDPGSLRFICVPADVVVPAYDLRLNDEEIELLERPGKDELVVMAILAFDEGRTPTANLLAPLVLNPSRRLGVQAVMVDSPYTVAHPLAGTATA